MSHYKDTTFQYYPSRIQIPEPLGTVTLEEFIRANKNPKKEIIELLSKIEKASIEGDLDTKSRLKEKLFYFTPAVITNGKGRSYLDIVGFNSLMVLDFDKIDNAPEFKQFLFDSLPCVIAAYLSPSKKGCKFIVRIDECKSVEDYKALFYGLATYLEKYEGFDPTSKNCCLPLYLSYDPGLLYRDDAKVWNIRGEQIDGFKPYSGDIEVLENVSEEDREKVFDKIRIALEKIEDTAHLIVRNTALVAGGFCGSGYITEQEAYDFMHDIISDIPYCKGKLYTYLRTTRDFIRKGTSSPLYLEK